MSKMQELTTERDMVAGTTPHQFRPFIYINRRLRIKAFGYHWRPRTLVLALLALAAVGYAAIRLIGGAK